MILQRKFFLFANKTIYLGFKYDGGDPDKTTTFELDDVKILR